MENFIHISTSYVHPPDEHIGEIELHLDFDPE